MITFAFKTYNSTVVAGRVPLAYTKENKERLRSVLQTAIDVFLADDLFPILPTIKLYLHNFKGLELKTYDFNPAKSHSLHSVRMHNGNKRSTVW